QDGLSDSKVEAVLRDAATIARSEGVEIETHRRKGDPADAILEVAKEQDADLIVVGNQGMTGARRVLGSVPNKITHHAPCSVMVVRTG
ncbi:MAG: universal stress protein, partial [Thermoleophilaceae bacterium]